MAWKTLKFRLTGDCPLLMHNGQLANPLSEGAKALKKVSNKRAKVDADHEKMAELEFAYSLYLDENGPAIPGEVIEAAICEGAKKTKEGKVAKSACVVPTLSSLEYDGPRTPEELYADKRFVKSAMVRVTTNRVVRTRPMFKTWGLTAEVEYEDSVCSEEQVERWLTTSGKLVGIGDWRPRYGRFTAVLVK